MSDVPFSAPNDSAYAKLFYKLLSLDGSTIASGQIDSDGVDVNVSQDHTTLVCGIETNNGQLQSQEVTQRFGLLAAGDKPWHPKLLKPKVLPNDNTYRDLDVQVVDPKGNPVEQMSDVVAQVIGGPGELDQTDPNTKTVTQTAGAKGIAGFSIRRNGAGPIRVKLTVKGGSLGTGLPGNGDVESIVIIN